MKVVLVKSQKFINDYKKIVFMKPWESRKKKEIRIESEKREGKKRKKKLSKRRKTRKKGRKKKRTNIFDGQIAREWDPPDILQYEDQTMRGYMADLVGGEAWESRKSHKCNTQLPTHKMNGGRYLIHPSIHVRFIISNLIFTIAISFCKSIYYKKF